MDIQPGGPVGIINVFTVAAEHQQELLAMITAYSKDVASAYPGFISARFHASLDGERVLGVVYWESQAACIAFVKSPDNQPFLQRCEALAQSVDSHFYSIIADVLPTGAAS